MARERHNPEADPTAHGSAGHPHQHASRIVRAAMRRGLLAEFDASHTCATAVRCLKERGWHKLEVYMPYTTKEINEALALGASPLPKLVFVAGCLGAALAYLILWYTNVYDYPLNVGGHPSHAVPAFIPITFETMVLVAGCTAFFGGLLLGGLPKLYHPVDELEGFDLISVDRFAIALDADDEHFEPEPTNRLLRELGAIEVRAFGVTVNIGAASASEQTPEAHA